MIKAPSRTTEFLQPEIKEHEILLHPFAINTISHEPLDTSLEPDWKKTVIQNFRTAVPKFEHLDCLGYRAGLSTSARELQTSYTWMDYAEVSSLVTRVACVLRKLGVEPGSKVGIYSRNSPLWIITDLACSALGAISVPLYDTLGPKRIHYCINHSGIRVLFTQQEFLPTVLAAWAASPRLERVVLMDSFLRGEQDVSLDSWIRKAIPVTADIDSLNLEDLHIDAAALGREGAETESAYTYNPDGASGSSGSSGHRAGGDGDSILRLEQANVTEDNEHLSDIIRRIRAPLARALPGDSDHHVDKEAVSACGVRISSTTVPEPAGHAPEPAPEPAEPAVESPVEPGATDTASKQIPSNLLLLTSLLSSLSTADVAAHKDHEGDPKDIYSIIYTSGTSGNPKAVVHSSATFLGCSCMGYSFYPYTYSRFTGERHTLLSYLPLAHVYARTVEIYSLIRGVRIAYYSGNTRNLTTDIGLSHPTVLLTVPRVNQKIYAGVMKKVQASWLTRTAFKAAMWVKSALEPLWIRSGRLSAIDDTVFRSIRRALGGKLELVVNGSAPLTKEVWNFFRLCTGARITIGYGSTETAISGACALPHYPINDVHMGHIVSFFEGKLIERPDASDYTIAKDHVGELLLRGPSLALGYYRLGAGVEEPREGDGIRELTPICDEDGWYHTGDLVRLNPDTTISYVCRAANVVKTQMGEFVDLIAVEDAIEASPLFTGVYAAARSDEAFPVMVASVDSTVLAHRLGLDSDRGKKSTSESLAYEHCDEKTRNSIHDLLASEAQLLVKKAGLKSFCVPKCVYWVCDVDWTADTDLTTPSLKKQHRAYAKRFAPQVAALYEQMHKAERK